MSVTKFDKCRRLHQAVIRANPKDIVAFSAEYFRKKAGIPGDPIPGSELVNKD
jgi:hypothetical protein